MSKKDLSYYINKDVSIIKCKKRAKELFNQNKNSEYKTLSQYKDLAAIELGFKNWFELQNTVKKKCELKFNIWEQNLVDDFENLLKECLNNKATDIHIEVKPPYGRIRTRINGELKEYKKEEKLSYDYLYEFSNTIFNKVFINSNLQLDLANFSTGSALYNINNKQAVIRFQSLPAYPSGFDFVLRINHSELYNDFPSLTALGYAESHVKQILEATSHNNGCFILAGATGQGKTTTIRTLLNQLHNKDNRRIASIENGVEYPRLNKGIIKIDCVIDYKHNFLEQSIYEEPVKKAISNKAEVIVTDETRCKNTARTMEEAQNSALFITNVHASSAVNITRRLEDFGINKETIASENFCRGLLYQKLLPVLCPHCSKDISTINDNKDYVEYLESFKNKYPNVSLDKVRIRNHDGCTKCNHGINSRTVCVEVVILDDTMRQLIKDNELEGLRNYWKSLSDKNLLSDDMTGKTVYEHALSKMLLGQIDPMDILKNFYPFD